MNATAMNVPIKPNSKTMSFRYGDELITFERVKRPQATGKVLIRVHPNCQVIASAPEDADSDAVLSAVKKRGRWIYKQLEGFRKQNEYTIPRQYTSGESHYYLGKQYLLKVIEAPEQVQGVKLLRGKLEVSVRTKSADKVKELLTQWYKARAKELFSKRLEVMLEQALWVEKQPPLRILTMRTQWGSCSPNGQITLNPHLVKAPRDCIDYVILHELCHIAEHNHSERFYRLMSQVMPKWEKIKSNLDQMAANLIQ